MNNVKFIAASKLYRKGNGLQTTVFQGTGEILLDMSSNLHSRGDSVSWRSKECTENI